MNLPGQPREIQSDPKLLQIAEQLLTHQYRATILAAILQHALCPDRQAYPGSQRLYLTLLGGGVFSNPPEVIAAALMANRALMLASGLDIRVVVFAQATPPVMDVLSALVAESGGAIYRVE